MKAGRELSSVWRLRAGWWTGGPVSQTHCPVGLSSISQTQFFDGKYTANCENFATFREFWRKI